MKKGSEHMMFAHSPDGVPLSIVYDDLLYYYVTNLQGDVVAILDATGTEVVTYTYDAWGNILTIDGSKATTLGQDNPLRYRGYVYDQETGLYYLQSRYYDPEIGRFLSADNILSQAENINGKNLFVYCFNNPSNMSDMSGHWPSWGQIGSFLTGTIIVAIATAAVISAAPVLAAAISVSYVSGIVYGVGVIACGVTAAVCGSSIMAESLTGKNPVRDAVGSENFDYLTMISTGGCVQGLAMAPPVPSKPQTPVIGKMNDLNKTELKPGEFKVADLLPDMGSPKANWQQNSGVLRSFMDGRPIRDVSPYPMENAGFLGAERNLLENHGYVYQDGYWIMP